MFIFGDMTLQNCDGAWISSFYSITQEQWLNQSDHSYLFLQVLCVICQYEIQYKQYNHYDMVILSKIYLHHVSTQTIIM